MAEEMVHPFSLWCAPVPIKHAIEQDALAPFPKPEAPAVDEKAEGCNQDRLMSSLPTKVYGKRRFLKYQATWWPEVFLPGVLAIQRRFQPRSSDVLLASYPKSGTTWMKALAFAIMSRKVYPLEEHPLLRLNPHDCVVHLPGAYAAGKESVVEALPSPRIMALHMPYSTLPDSVVVNSDCKIIYVCRDPKDVLVSLWHYYNKVRPDEAHLSQFHDLYESFCQGDTIFGPWWDNVLGYFRASLDMPTRVLFLRYEDMLEDTASAVMAIAHFVGCPFSGEEERAKVVEAIVKLCSFDELKNLNTNKSGSHGLLRKHASSSYFRKGVAGDWMDHMTEEMAHRIDTIVQGKFQGSGLNIKSAAST
ncbi:cytosolic sulfotransferase 12-like [Oryza brachyantha]|uniref:Sulfotransferase n=1 Tax=Oryza brachyantha TaxID=4533 RepID=J3L0S6_ORYBR|nr:cytosolic sulfotransferase 12-like [Oryza brachyantha]